MKYLIACLSCVVFCVEPAQLAVARGMAMYTVGFAATGSTIAHIGDFSSVPPSPISGLPEGSATSKANLAIGGVTVGRSGGFLQAPTVSMERLGDSAVKGRDYTEVNDFAIPMLGGFASATNTSMLGLNNDRIFEGSETMRVEESLADTTVTPAAMKNADFTLTLSQSSANEDDDTVNLVATVTADAPPGEDTLMYLGVFHAALPSVAVDGNDYGVKWPISTCVSTCGVLEANLTQLNFLLVLTIIDDDIPEGDETITIVISSDPSFGNLILAEDFTITDNETESLPLVLTLSQSSANEDDGNVNLVATVTADPPPGEDTPMYLSIYPYSDSRRLGIAEHGSDYTVNEAISTRAGVLGANLTQLNFLLGLTIIDDDVPEGDEKITIIISSDLGFNIENIILAEDFTIDDESGVRVDTLMAEVNATGGYTITALVRQNMGAPVRSVVLHYGDGMTFEMTQMEMSSEGSYTAELMAPAEGSILYYYVLATNEDGLTATYPPEGRYQDISDYTGGSKLVLLDFEDGDAGDKSDVGHAVVYRGGEPMFAEDALVLDGVADHAEILGSSLGASEEFALEIMFNANDFDAAVLDAGGTYLVSKPARCAACWEESTFSLLWERSAASGTLLAARFWNPEYGESGQVELEIPMPLVSGQWYHAVLEVQRNGAGQRAVLRLRDQSGMLHGEDVAVLPAHPAISVYPIFVGHIGDRGFFDGRIDDVAFYNYARFGLSLASSEDAWEVPEGYVLEQNYPNPFNPVTTIRYDLARVGHVSLEVSDLLGRRVAMLVDAVQEAGAQEVRFDARDLPSGMYLYRLRVEDFVSVKKMVLLK